MERTTTIRDLVRRNVESLVRAQTVFGTIAAGYTLAEGRRLMREAGFTDEQIAEKADLFDFACKLVWETLTQLGNFTGDDLIDYAKDLDRQDAALRLLATQA